MKPVLVRRCFKRHENWRDGQYGGVLGSPSSEHLLSGLSRTLNHWKDETVDLGHGPPGYTLKIAIEAGGGLKHIEELLFAFCPKARHRFPLTIEVGLHVAEFLDDCIDPMAEARPG